MGVNSTASRISKSKQSNPSISSDSLASNSSESPQITAEERLHYIEVAAYFIAEKEGFSGDPQANWQAAEHQVDNHL
ncbi:MAG TPA: DUF2934 domain-containing protein, partial [Rhodocyclaceae bacterium]|nr:DUF2934 domain-containing protein [Rhodocyclaceae bacterium]